MLKIEMQRQCKFTKSNSVIIWAFEQSDLADNFETAHGKNYDKKT